MNGWPLAVVLIACLVAIVIVAVSVVWLVITTQRPPAAPPRPTWEWREERREKPFDQEEDQE